MVGQKNIKKNKKNLLREYRCGDAIHVPVYKNGKFLYWLHSTSLEKTNVSSLACKKLWISVIRQAYDDLTCEEPPVREEALNWFMSDKKNQNSYLFLCSLLGFDAETGKANAIKAYRNRK